MILFISQGTIYSTRHLAMLKAVGWKLVYVKPRRFPGTVKPRLVDGLIKLYAWNLTQYKMIATFDADAVVIGSIEEPFKYLHLKLHFNAGILFFRPSVHHYRELIRYSSNRSYYTLDYPQQNLLNRYFHNQWTPLPIKFNLISHLHLKYPSWFDYKNDIRIIHFAGAHKPWNTPFNITNLKLDFNLLWRRYGENLLCGYNWTKSDFLVPDTLKDLKDLPILDEILGKT
ncbi:unnamed protein product [Rotaria sp. Silwood2]|nr:unnamed protein product [Rotaria sp. Silwood2]CAF4631569.1 unnamed protein product [Rotaria sp. Silwood2]